MANVTAAFYPTVATDVASSGQAVWTTPGNITANDAAVATVTLGIADNKGGNFISDNIASSAYGISIPAAATILGVVVEIAGSGYIGVSMVKPGQTGTSKLVTLGGSNTVFTAYGGTTDLWGYSGLTGSDVMAAGFGFNFNAQNASTQASGSATIQAVRVTVYWDSPPLPNGTIQKSYLYQAYRGGVYLGLIPNVTSEFAFSQDINTAGSQIVITSAISGDISALDAPTIDDEFGVPLQTESGQNLQTERYPDIIGNNNSKGLFRNGNQIIVTEISNYHPNGIRVFSGDVQRWQTVFGGVDGDMVVLTVYSDGGELNNFIMTGGDILEQSQTATADGSSGVTKTPAGGYVKVGQTFTIGAGITTLSAISILTLGGDTLTLSVYSSLAAWSAGSASLGFTSLYIAAQGSATEFKFNLPFSLKVTPLDKMFFTVEAQNNNNVNVYSSSTSIYSGGEGGYMFYSGGSGGGGFTPYGGTTDLWFKTYSGGNTTTITYSTTDPTNMVLDMITRYNSKGGIIKVGTGTTDLTARSITYKFSVATLFDGITKALELAPYDFYWYVDIGTNTLYFKRLSNVAKYTFIKGKHYSSLNLSATTENVKNLLYFTGGIPSGTTNLFSQYSDQASIASNKQRLDRQTDNRVTIQATADFFGTSFINSVKNENYETSITVLDTTMDISLIKVGDTVGFAGNGTFVDGLILQIARIDYTPGQAILTLGQLPPRVNQTLRDIQDSLTDLETLANPTAPS